MIDVEYCDGQRNAVFRRRRLTVLAIALGLVLAVSNLSSGPSDVHIIEGSDYNAERLERVSR